MKFYYHANASLRVGDEIQTTAFIKYLQNKNICLYYKDCNKYISALKHFKDNSVIFCSDNLYKLPKIDSFSLWYWSEYFKNHGFYTELNKTYSPNNTSINILFIPVINADYNQIRQMNLDTTMNLFLSLNQIDSNIKMIIDKDKRSIFNINHPNVIYSNSFDETFEYICKSKIYIGGDTGVTHYAGAIRHPNMILIYGNEKDAHLRNQWQRNILANQFSEPELLSTTYSSTPCCPQPYKLLWLENNNIPVNRVLDCIC